eukprot:CAMPEP_0196823436 /NCGR_PEP_ID=MMETSP1362-20130617/87386_1 /TAXON_ID=163516 /ORGANISM="Leptocylindrus danicus, Strain CCMP1856" /LENGTH=553 /DNA_ID=CAMNT_0042203295 /DNA_START=130 /DNA_END=1791 /DNA_ORIENTATION=-
MSSSDDDFEEELFDASLIEDSFEFKEQQVVDARVQSGNAMDSSLKEDLDLNGMTVSELKAQLRQRNLKVSGRKADLVDRLSKAMCEITASKEQTMDSEIASAFANKKGGSSAYDGNEVYYDSSTFVEAEIVTKSSREETAAKKSAVEEYAEKTLGKKPIDVSEYVEDDDDNEEEEVVEVWGSDAQIINDLDGVSPVVDNLSRTVIEYKGAHGEKINSFVVASKEALKGFLKGGSNASKLSPEEELKKEVTKINKNRKKERIEWQGEFFTVMEEAETPSSYSMIGASLSAKQVHGIIFLSDVRGSGHEDTRALCDKIAFECQPCVMMAPDLFRDYPWVEDEDNSGFNTDGKTYEEWRATHPEGRVHLDILASAAVLRERYSVSSVNVFGTCFGGGRALEVAAGWTPADIEDFIGDDQKELPLAVNPATCVAWYPTRYDAPALFDHAEAVENKDPVAIMAIFAENDKIQGARKEDAEELKQLLNSNRRIKDNMVKVFEGEDHGFAHVGLKNQESDEYGNSEVAALLSTAWLDTYSRVYLPTIGQPVKSDEKWGSI